MEIIYNCYKDHQSAHIHNFTKQILLTLVCPSSYDKKATDSEEQSKKKNDKRDYIVNSRLMEMAGQPISNDKLQHDSLSRDDKKHKRDRNKFEIEKPQQHRQHFNNTR